MEWYEDYERDFISNDDIFNYFFNEENYYLLYLFFRYCIKWIDVWPQEYLNLNEYN